VTVRLRALSRTLTEPRLTRVTVASQRSSTRQMVPRTVAELTLPVVRQRPLASPHRWRILRLEMRALAPRARAVER
jgi:hypothetical protein